MRLGKIEVSWETSKEKVGSMAFVGGTFVDIRRVRVNVPTVVARAEGNGSVGKVLVGRRMVVGGLAAWAGLAWVGSAEAKVVLRRSKEEILEEKRRREEEGMTEEEIEEKRRMVAEERKRRLEKQKELVAEEEKKRMDPTLAKNEAEIEANLRANYYYPTAKKRYLPRIKRVVDEIDEVEALLARGEWRPVDDFSSGVAKDAVSPMKVRFTQWMLDR